MITLLLFRILLFRRKEFNFFLLNMLIGFKVGFSFLLPQKIFLIFCGGITLIIIEFSNYYMKEREIFLFKKFLLFFLLFIIFLTSGENLFSIFLGWEGVGIISFLLIGWFTSREVAIFSSKKAVYYNRVGDFFFFFLVCWEGRSQILLNRRSVSVGGGEVVVSYLENHNYSIVEWILILRLCLCVFVKSSQFGFNPWLTSAMEGPTPVRALLHSSTIVVAGVFFLFTNYHYFSIFPPINNVLIITSRITLLITSLAALTHNDMKKIIALSTARQLRLIVFFLSLGEKDLGFFHLLRHGYFKALLFLCRGVFIHDGGDQQDSRNLTKMGIWKKTFFKVVFTGGLLGLMGIPFVGAFFRKHLFIEVLVGGGGNFFIFIFFFFSLVLTFLYSIKLFSISNIINYNNQKILKNIETLSFKKNLVFPLIRLCLFRIFFGFYFFQNFSPEKFFLKSFFVFLTSFLFLRICLLRGGVFIFYKKKGLTNNFILEYGYMRLLNRTFFNLFKAYSYFLDKNFEKIVLRTFFKKVL